MQPLGILLSTDAEDYFKFLFFSIAIIAGIYFGFKLLGYVFQGIVWIMEEFKDSFWSGLYTVFLLCIALVLIGGLIIIFSN